MENTYGIVGVMGAFIAFAIVLAVILYSPVLVSWVVDTANSL